MTTPKPEGGSRRDALLAGAVLFLAAVAVAGAFVTAPHNGGDNAGYVSLAYSLVHDGSYRDLYDPAGLPHTKYPPLFPLLLAVLVAAGVKGWAGLKSVAALSTVAAVGFTYLLARRRLGGAWAAGVAVVLAFSSAVVYYSHWVLSDPTFLALTVAALWALEDGRTRLVAAGVALAGLAYFTRSAGLPLLAALGLWLVLERRWRTLAASAGALGVPALLWWLRARGVGGVAYVSEFWLADPYDPSRGTVGPTGLLARAVGNTASYLTAHIPGGVVGGSGTFAAGVGVLLAGVALLGWVGAVRRRPGPVELFLPLYAGLILLWPEVWSGDRFALPLYPLLFLFAAHALKEGPLPVRARVPAAVALLALLLLPAMRGWAGSARQASACNAAVRASGPWACYGPRMARFAEAAAWAGENLPAGSAVMSRKPRIFFVLSGVPSRTFPFVDDPDVQLAEADAVGARYVLLDPLDGLASRYVGGAIRARPGAFCHVQTLGRAEEGAVGQLLGFLPPSQRTEGADRLREGGVAIAGCPDDYVSPGAGPDLYPSSLNSTRIPLLSSVVP